MVRAMGGQIITGQVGHNTVEGGLGYLAARVFDCLVLASCLGVWVSGMASGCLPFWALGYLVLTVSCLSSFCVHAFLCIIFYPNFIDGLSSKGYLFTTY